MVLHAIMQIGALKDESALCIDVAQVCPKTVFGKGHAW